MSDAPHPRFCLCCQAPSPRAPVRVWNRPGLSAIGFRIGTFATFREAMLEQIVRQAELADLATRESDDHGITLIELFAALGDLLTFYSERIANELFLRSARERDSILRLVRLIGYQLRPGLAANSMLEFSLDHGATTRIRKGLKVMSVPGQDERPQTFETLEEIQADARLNALAAYAPPLPFNAFHQGRDEAPLLSRPEPLSAGDRFVVFGLSTLEEKSVDGLERARDGERLRFSPPVQSPLLWPGVARAAKVERRLRFFAHNAPDSFQRFRTNPAIPPSQRWETVNAGDTAYQMNFGAARSEYPLDARYDTLQPGTSLLADAGPGADPRLRTAVVIATEDRPEAFGQAQDTVTHATLMQTVRGRPSVLVGGTWTHLFARSGVGRVLTFEAVTPTWSALGRVVASAELAAVATGASSVSLFVRDAGGRLRWITWSPGGWGAWEDRGGILTTPPAPVRLATGDLLVFVRGLDFGLWVQQIAPGPPTWHSLNGFLTSEPAPVSWGGQRLDVFVRGPDRGLWRRVRQGLGWDPWESLGGTLAGAPAAAATQPNRLDVVALDDHGALIHRRWTGSAWTDWLGIGGELRDTPAIVATGPDRVDVFARGQDDQLYRIARTGADWGPWQALGGTLASAPAVSRFGGRLQVAARDAEGVLITRLWTGGWGPWSRQGFGLGSIPDRRRTRLFQIARPDLEFRDYDYPRRIRGGRIAARLADAPGLEALDKGRRILLDDGASRRLARVTASLALASNPGDTPDHLFVDFEPPLPAPLGTAVLKANVAKASHGETQPEEPLGNGDATRAFARYRLRRSPLTYVQSESAIEGEAELEIRVNGERWQEVPSLYARGPTERVYTARQTDAGETVITFGDGRTGARVPSGAMNVVASYRTGVGLVGRMKADQLSTPLERPAGLRAVTNPLPADGGADPETGAKARSAAPGTVRTFGRAVSLRDFEWLATTSGLVSLAYATWVWHKLEKAVHLTVGAAAGGTLSAESLETLHAALTAARDPNRPLLLANLVRVPLVIGARLLREPAFTADAVLAAARAALAAHFDSETMPLGRAVHASDIYAVLQGARGVLAVDLDLFHLKEHEDLTPTERAVRAVTAEPVQQHVRIFSARPTPGDTTLIDRYARAGFTGPPPAVLAAEQAWLEDPAADVVLRMVEAL